MIFKVLEKLAPIQTDIVVSLFWQSMLQVLGLMVISQTVPEITYDISNTGLFGWLQKDVFLFNALIFSLLCGIGGSYGLNFVVGHIDTNLMMNLMLMRPINA